MAARIQQRAVHHPALRKRQEDLRRLHAARVTGTRIAVDFWKECDRRQQGWTPPPDRGTTAIPRPPRASVPDSKPAPTLPAAAGLTPASWPSFSPART